MSNPETGRATQVARRALIHTLLFERSLVDHEPDRDEASRRCALLRQEAAGLGLLDDAEPGERDYLLSAPGAAARQARVDAYWRLQSAAVLAWALRLADLPPYDEHFFASALPPFDEVLAASTLRPAEEVQQVVRQTTIVRWRLREWERGRPGPFDLRGSLTQHACFRPAWLQGLAFDAGGELLIATYGDGDLGPRRPLHEQADDSVFEVQSLMLERQRAACWLRGDALLLSQVRTDTILSDLDPPNERAAAAAAAVEAAAQAGAARRAEARAAVSGGVADLDDAELVGRAEALRPRLRRFELPLLDDARRFLAAGRLTDAQRAQLARLLAEAR